MNFRIVKNTLKIQNLLRHVSVHAGTIISEPKSVPSWNYRYGSTVPVDTCNARFDKHSGTVPVILARHWLWLPDDGSCVNRNLSEQVLYFSSVFNNPAIHKIEFISSIIKYLLLMMHSVAMKIRFMCFRMVNLILGETRWMWDRSLTRLTSAQHNINTNGTFTATPRMEFDHITAVLKR